MRKLLLVAVVFAAIVLAMASNLSAHTPATHTWMPRADDDLNQRDRIVALWGTSTVFLPKTASSGDFYGANRGDFGTIIVYDYTWIPDGSIMTVQGNGTTLWGLPANVIRDSTADAEVYAFAPSCLATITLTKSFDTSAVDVGNDSYTHGAPSAGYYAAATSNNTVTSELGEFNSSGFSPGAENGTRGKAIPLVPTLASGIGRIGADDTAGFGPPALQGSPAARSGSASGREHSLLC
jgi:hypothetical protein